MTSANLSQNDPSILLEYTSENTDSRSIDQGIGNLTKQNGTILIPAYNITTESITYTITGLGKLDMTAEDSTTVTINLLPTSANRTCIAVIDENDSTSSAGMEFYWTQFRQNWPDRPFYLLQPGGYQGLGIPISFLEEVDPDTYYK
jgi:hypothetical protein